MSKTILLQNDTKIKGGDLPRAIGRQIPPHTQILEGTKKISHPANGWRFYVPSCPFCGRGHVHTWNPDRQYKRRWARCEIGVYILSVEFDITDTKTTDDSVLVEVQEFQELVEAKNRIDKLNQTWTEYQELDDLISKKTLAKDKLYRRMFELFKGGEL